MSAKQITYENIDPKVRSTIMVGLTLAMLIACLDGTIVSTCGATIASELNGTALYSWMITAYMLCETVMIPISGKLSDLYGRNRYSSSDWHCSLQGPCWRTCPPAWR